MASSVLTFSKVGKKWVSVATVTKNYNLHIEGGGDIVMVAQKTAGNKFGIVGRSANSGDCYDFDFGNYVYPKVIKVTCDNEPSVAYITEEA